MAQHEEDLPNAGAGSDPAEQLGAPRGRRGRKVFLAICALLLLGIGYVWFSREQIADDIISAQLSQLGLPATYEIEAIGPQRQVLRNIVVGDPKRPDLTIERAEIAVRIGFSAPEIGLVRLVKPRFYGTYRGGKLSFGSLDPLLFGKSGEPFRLPDLLLRVEDGRGLIDGDIGPVGIKLHGEGPLRGGFAGVIAAIAPHANLGACRLRRASIYGRVTISAEKPRFLGPVRVAEATCDASGVRLSDAAIELDGTADKALDGGEGTASFRMGSGSAGGGRMASASGTLRLAFRKQALNARYEIAGLDITTPHLDAAMLTLTGVARGSLARVEAEGQLEGSALKLGQGLDGTLRAGQSASQGTLVAPLLAQLRNALLREGANSSLAASFIARRAGDGFSLVVPQATLRGTSGAPLLSASRFQLSADGSGPLRMAGNVSTSGAGIPRMTARMERRPGGQLAMRLAMAPYRAGDAEAAVPSLAVVQLADGKFGFAGEARLSGALPGGRASNLVLPLDGNWSPAAGLALWRRCVDIGFDRLSLASLAFERRKLQVCPQRGGAIVRSDARGTRIAAGAPSLDVSGRLGASPIRIRSGPLGVAVPGTLAARALDIELGPAATASRFRVANLEARIGGDVAGRFSGSDVFLAAVPLDLRDASGDWRYAGGKLMLTGSAFRLEDRQADDRFQPLVARGATLTLADNRIAADATLHEPASDQEIVRTVIRHDLGTGKGSADLTIDGILFSQKLQPDTISRLALGVVANANGIVRGIGRIVWNPQAVSSTGSFTSDGLDFAAAFGPVKGAAGTVVFSDLLGMVTAPDQQLRIASINPGIEVNDGLITFEMQRGNVLQIKQGSWPFLDGRLTLQPVRMALGVAETRRYVLVIEGLNAARFVERMELANLSTTGTFDGAMPLVFDENGGRIEGGMLHSRPPGGNVSYVGALTYKDLSTMANFAFDALKSLNYREMSIGMDGALEGEIITRVRFDGVSQGEGTKRNFLTDRVAKLPIRFNVNLRAPFFQLITSFKSFYDPAYVRDPRSLGLLDEKGQAVPRPQIMLPPVPGKPDIQR
jgi:hypothetical protein